MLYFKMRLYNVLAQNILGLLHKIIFPFIMEWMQSQNEWWEESRPSSGLSRGCNTSKQAVLADITG